MIVRLGPAVNALDEVETVVNWKYPVLTGGVYGVYMMICLYPVTILILPQLTLIAFILYRYNTRNSSQPTPLTPKEPQAEATTTITSLESQQYMKNLQFLQNFMGLFCDTHDQLMAAAKLLDWRTDVQATNLILRSTLSFIPFTLIIHYFSLYKYIFMVGGTIVFFHRTRVWRAITSTIPKVVVRKVLSVLTSIVTSIPVPDSAVDLAPEFLDGKDGGSSGVTTMAELFENQRWWAGPGWTPHMLKIERPSWSDDSGQVERSSKSDITDPAPGWIWTADEWELDLSWASTDSDGWVYTDHNWMSPTGQANIFSLTRRRKWIRPMMALGGEVSVSNGGVVDFLGKKRN
ncbi:peroxisome- protein [Dinochytrium kinnereticum]|nr:peroxisome- protein [Dinochytrium kinnereticum]